MKIFESLKLFFSLEEYLKIMSMKNKKFDYILATCATSLAKDVNKRLTPVEKIEQSEPYRFLLSTVHGIQDKYNQINAISLKGIFKTIYGFCYRKCFLILIRNSFC